MGSHELLDHIANNPQDENVIALKWLIKSDEGDGWGLLGKEADMFGGMPLQREVSQKDIENPVEYDERIFEAGRAVDRDFKMGGRNKAIFENAGWGDDEDFIEYDEEGNPQQQEEGSGVYIMNPAGLGEDAVKKNNASQNGFIVIGKLQPGKSLWTSNDWINLHPRMAGSDWRPGRMNGLKHLSDYPEMYTNYPRSEAQKEMVRLLKLNPEIKEVAKSRPASAHSWNMLMKALVDEGWGPGEAFDAIRSSYRLPSKVATYGKEDANGRKSLISDMPDDYVMDKFVDSIYASAKALELAEKKERAEHESYRGSKKKGERSKRGTGAAPRLVQVYTTLPALTNAKEFLDNNMGASVKNANEFIAKSITLGDDEGLPLEVVSSMSDPGSPVFRYFQARLKGASGKDAFFDAFKIDPDRIPSDAEIKDFVSGVSSGLEPLMKQRHITKALLESRF